MSAFAVFFGTVLCGLLLQSPGRERWSTKSSLTSLLIGLRHLNLQGQPAKADELQHARRQPMHDLAKRDEMAANELRAEMSRDGHLPDHQTNLRTTSSDTKNQGGNGS